MIHKPYILPIFLSKSSVLFTSPIKQCDSIVCKKEVYWNGVNVSTSFSDASNLKTELDKIYKPALVSFEVGTDNRISDVSKGIYIDPNSNTEAPYSADMQSVIKEFKKSKLDKKTSYVFLIKEFTGSSSHQGYMPYRQQFGFVKYDPSAKVLARTVAHELGHGLFALKHTQELSLPTVSPYANLMSYEADVYLHKFQWDIIQNEKLGEVEFDSASEVMEVKWGQLGNLDQIIEEMRKSVVGNTASSLLIGWIKHFGQNRMYERDAEGKLIDTKGSINVKRYLYTENIGWIDMEHFFSFANYTRKNGIMASSFLAYITEEVQGTTVAIGPLKWDRSASAYTYEDIPSDFAGIEFWMKYGDQIKNKQIGFINAVKEYFTDLGAKEPVDAPNYEYIPYMIDNTGKYTPRNMGDGWTGEKLKEEHKKVYDKLPQDIKDKIKEAHETILD